MPRVLHFDLNASNPDRAINFYEKVFGWTFNKWEGPFDYWMIKTGEENTPGIDGGMNKTEDPGLKTSVTIDVSSLDEYIRNIQENGGTILDEKMAIPGVGYFAQFKDTEGNILGMMEDNPSAI